MSEHDDSGDQSAGPSPDRPELGWLAEWAMAKTRRERYLADCKRRFLEDLHRPGGIFRIGPP